MTTPSLLVKAIAKQMNLQICHIPQREWAYERGFRYRITGWNTKMYARGDADALRLITRTQRRSQWP